MRCPWCGAPVMIHGQWWECGFCGDSGRLKTEEPETFRVPVEVSVTVSEGVDLPETWKYFRKFLQQKMETPVSEEALEKILVHEITRAIRIRGEVDPEQLETLDAFWREGGLMTPWGQLEDAIRKKRPLYGEECRLEETFCGSLWQQVIRCSGREECPELSAAFSELEDITNDYAGGKDPGRQDRLLECFAIHWDRYRFFSPDWKQAAERLKNGDASCFDWDARDVLVHFFPGFFAGRDGEEMRNFYLDEEMADLADGDPELRERMKQVLLDLGPCGETAELVQEAFLDPKPWRK